MAKPATSGAGREPMNRRRLILLTILAVLAVAVAGVTFSRATFNSTSTSTVTASAERVSSWLALYSQSTDPAGLTGYATQRVQTGVGPVCATGSNETLALVMGGIRANNTSYTFTRAFTIQTPAAFPDAAVTQVTVTATYVADPATGLQPIRDCRFNTVGATRGNATVTLGRNVKYQANVRLRATGFGWVTGQTYYPTVRVTVTYTGGPAAYYIYNIPLSVTIVAW